MDEAIAHCTRGLGIWDWAGNDDDGEPDVVLACAGDVPTLETLAAAALLRKHLPELKVRVVNVVDLMRLQPDTEHPHGLSDSEFDALFTTDKPVIFAFHGYPWLIHRLTYRRTNHAQPPRARLQGGGHHDHAVRHGDAQRPRPLPPGHGRHRPGPGARAAAPPTCARRWSTRGCAARAYTRELRRGRSRDGETGPGPACKPTVRILVVNAGSSSLKLSLLDGRRRIDVRARPARRRRRSTPARSPTRPARLARAPTPSGIGSCTAATASSGRSVIDAAVARRSWALTDLAPLHQPKSLAALDAVSAAAAGVPAVACFDTAFHATIPAAAATYALPARVAGALGAPALRLSRPVSRLRARARAAELLGGSRRACGSSPATSARRLAVRRARRRHRRHHDGLHPARRPGDGDPVRHRRPRAASSGWRNTSACPPHEIATALEHASGLLALAGTADMREVEAAADGDPDAQRPSTSTSTGWPAVSPR